MVASTISKNLLVSPFPRFLLGLYQDKACKNILNKHQPEAQIYAKYVWLFWHVLDERAPSFARKQLFLNGEIKTWHITFFKNFNKIVPNF